MISLADFQPLKTNLFSSATGVLGKDTEDISVTNHAIQIEEVPVQTTLRDDASFRRLPSLIGLKYLHQPSNFVLNILTLTCCQRLSAIANL